jgi:Phosphate transport regulator (distant homolog of PhoU)
MSIISKLFGKSPFEPLHQHMLKVKACVGLVRPLMDAFLKGEQEKVKDVAKKIFKAEHDADIVKKKSGVVYQKVYFCLSQEETS